MGCFLDCAGLGPELEKAGLLQPCPEQPDAQRRRPADVYVPSWKNGFPAAFDLAITSPHRRDVLTEAANKIGHVAESYEHYKRQYLNTAADCQSQGIAFIPIIGKPAGGWGPSAVCTFKNIARNIAFQTGREAGDILREHRQTMSIAVRRHHARAIFRRLPADAALTNTAEAAALAALAAD